jgi:hypothetical protein
MRDMMTIPKSLLTSSRLRSALVATTVMLSLFAGVQKASATTITPVTLGTASTYGLVIGAATGSSVAQGLTVGGAFNITGNAGIGTYGAINLSGTTNVTGSVYEDSNVSQTGNGAANISGTVATQSMAQVMADAKTASTNATNDSTATKLTAYGSSISITSSATSIAIKALSAGENILNISSLSLSNGTLTFDDNGFAGAKFIINITGNLSATSTGSAAAVIKGINGATSSDILFNVTGAGSTISLTGINSSTYIGTILAPAANVTIGGNGTLTGNIIQGFNNAGKAYTVTEQSSGFNLSASAYKPSTVTKTPEPSTIAIFGAGIAGLVVARRWRHRFLRA